MKKFLLFLTVAIGLAACNEREIISDESEIVSSDPENEGLNLKFAVDWSALAEKPTGMTMLFYPKDGGEVLKYHFDAVDLVSVSLPEQDYSLIYFNQSVEEFENFRFDLDDFETASVTALSAESLTAGTLAITSQKSVQGTRGMNLRVVMMPGTLAVGSLASVKSEAQKVTRGMNLKIAVLPNIVVKGMSLEIPVPDDVQGEFSVQGGSLTNLSAGFRIKDGEPLEQTLELPLPADVWKISTSDDAAQTPILTATFNTLAVSSTEETRSASDYIEPRNELTVSILLADGTTKELNADVTEEVTTLK